MTKPIILTCNDGIRKPTRFILEIDERTGDAQIIKDGAALIDRDTSAVLEVRGPDHEGAELIADIRLTVEAA